MSFEAKSLLDNNAPRVNLDPPREPLDLASDFHPDLLNALPGNIADADDRAQVLSGGQTPFANLPRAKGPFFPDGRKYVVGFVDGTMEYIVTDHPTWPVPDAGSAVWTTVDRYQQVFGGGSIDRLGLRYVGTLCINLDNVKWVAEYREPGETVAAAG